jgi:hypothetical protein
MPNDPLTELAVKLNYIAKAVEEMKNQITELRDHLEEKYVSRAEFDPVKKIVFGGVGFVLVAVLGALVALIVKK